MLNLAGSRHVHFIQRQVARPYAVARHAICRRHRTDGRDGDHQQCNHGAAVAAAQAAVECMADHLQSPCAASSHAAAAAPTSVALGTDFAVAAGRPARAQRAHIAPHVRLVLLALPCEKEGWAGCMAGQRSVSISCCRRWTCTPAGSRAQKRGEMPYLLPPSLRTPAAHLRTLQGTQSGRGGL